MVWHYDGLEERKWAQRDFKFGRTMSTACIVDDVVYIAELHGYLHCLDAKTGKHFWQYDIKASIWGSPYYVDGKVFLGNDNELFVFKHEKKHDVIDEFEAAKDAKTMKEARAIHKKVRDEVEKKYLLSRTEFDAIIHSTPVVANGVLYVHDLQVALRHQVRQVDDSTVSSARVRNDRGIHRVTQP